MRQEDDKTIIDPENLVAASTNGYEAQKKHPGSLSTMTAIFISAVLVLPRCRSMAAI
jgi:hypothetical protein